MGQESEDGYSNSLSPGLYIALLPIELEESTRGAYIVYWPEVVTWDDAVASPSIRHNRTTFMRYLTKMTDQIVALVSPSQAWALSGTDGGSDKNCSTEQANEYLAHLSSFELVRPTDSEKTENSRVSVRPGFKISVQSNLIPEKSRVQLIPGEHTVGLLVIGHESQSPGSIRHHIYPLMTDKRDTSFCEADRTHPIRPKIDTQHKFEFSLPKNRSIEFIHLIRDKCLVVISEKGKTRIYVQDNLTIDHAINATHGKRTLSHDSMGGSQCKFALDEVTRLFAIVHGKKGDQKLSTYIFDESFTDLWSRSSPVSLRGWGWYSKQITVTKICFRPGLEEVCLLDTSGKAHIYSFSNQQFRRGYLQIGQSALDTLPNPEPSCLLIITGVFVTELSSSDGHRVISRLGTNTTHLISFSRDSQTITPPARDATQTGVSLFRQAGFDQSCSSLLDCHLDVWTRYPIVAPEEMTLLPKDREPKELTLMSRIPLTKAQSYFSGLKSKLAVPKLGLLSLAISGADDELHYYPGSSKVSQFKLGGYVQEFLCLVPLHLMITKGNQFYLMYDGVWSPNGDIAQITDMLSLGWYEPLFRYSPSKPVRIVSSIGKRHWWKTYSLDHLANTSFGVCGDRRTQGIWLSCTPADKYLLVALDVKGVHLTEQNNENSRLMGLFSAAVSNLVILRENYTVIYHPSKLATGLLSLTRFMNPDDSPSLFNSMLTIVVKDVSDPNENGVFKEFSCELQKLIEHADERNAIPSLHRGGIQVIPWPVINTTDFYAMFTHLHEQLFKGQPSHPSGSVLLHNLKIMMAKIKAHDWAPLDQSLATHRAKKLLECLPRALSHGQDTFGSLKNMRTNESLHAGCDHANVTFWVPTFDPEDSPKKETLNEQALSMKRLVDSYEVDPENRQRTRDTEYIETIKKGIYDLLEQRLEFVQQWATVNTEPFPQDNPHIREFLRKLAMAKTTMRDATRICASRCNKCMLLCLNVRHHPGEHNCGTNHACIFDCDLSESNERREPCGLPAGHEERHMCHGALSDPTVPRLLKSGSGVTHKEPNLAPRPHPCALSVIEQLRAKLDQETRARQTLERKIRDSGEMLSHSGVSEEPETSSRALNLHPRPESL
ncbi:hypothetical protein RSAG8_05555, partial [Rhizoctonia solani AG-8 WAC10335]